MKKIKFTSANILSNEELKKIIGKGCPAYDQAECIRDASNIENPDVSAIIMSLCLDSQR